MAALESELVRLQQAEKQLSSIEAGLASADADLAARTAQASTLGATVATQGATIDRLSRDLESLRVDHDDLSDSAFVQLALLGYTADQVTTDLTSLGELLDDTKAAASTYELSGSCNFPEGEWLPGTKEMQAVEIDVPGPGSLILTLDGHAHFFGGGRTIQAGIGDSNTFLDVSANVGRLGSPADTEFQNPYSVTGSFVVSAAGKKTYYALCGSNPFNDFGEVTVHAKQLTAIWVPQSL